jgi:RNA polymerase sigma factor (sigma-70 family)
MRLKESPAPPAREADAARKRAAVELIARHGVALERAAHRYSLCAADAEDAYQRTLEILLTKAPSDRGRDLLGWSKTVVKHEALAIRRNRERLLGSGRPRNRDGEDRDPVALIPSGEDGPDARLERREEIARSREALLALKPAELRALSLLAEGYSYAEIGEITGFSRTKINRCLAEGRERFRRLLSRSEDGTRCTEMGMLLSAFCDGETSADEAAAVREHLRVCASCRAAVRAYRTAPARIAALTPLLPDSRSLLERAQEFLLGLHSRLPGVGGGAADASVTQVAAAGGTGGAGVAALAKALAVCAGTVGGAAACVATGVAPAPADLAPDRAKAPRIERISEQVMEQPAAPEQPPAPVAEVNPEPRQPQEVEATDVDPPPPVEAAAGAVEYTEPAPEPVASAESEVQTSTSGSAAGEFGP